MVAVIVAITANCNKVRPACLVSTLPNIVCSAPHVIFVTTYLLVLYCIPPREGVKGDGHVLLDRPPEDHSALLTGWYKLNDNTVLLVMSDHGFGQFARCFDLNHWLYDSGYLTVKDTSEETDPWHARIDWGNTRCYGLGLTGLYLNLKGREEQGIVEPGAEAEALKQ